jgi:cell division protein FtsX
VRQILRAASHGAARGAGGLVRQPFGTAAAVMAVAVGFALLSLAGAIRHNLDALTGRWSKGASMIVYLQDGVKEARARQLAEALAAMPAVEEASWVPPERALAELRELLGSDSEVARGLEPDMVPASLEVVLAEGVLDVARTHPWIERLERSAGVDEVVFAGEWVAVAGRLDRALRRGAYWLGLLVAIGCGYVLAVTIRLRQAEAGGVVRDAGVWSAVGASSWFVRGPRAVEGALLGALGAAFGLAVGYLVFRAARAPAEAALVAALGPLSLDFVPVPAAVKLVAFGAGLGLTAGITGKPRETHALA